MTGPDVIAALLAAFGAGGLGFTLGTRRERAAARADVDAAQADVAMWRRLASDLHAENGRLRCKTTPVPRNGEEPPSGKPNALHMLRTRLGFGLDEVAQALGIRIPEVEALEHTRLGLLNVAGVQSFVGALGCRLDVVAQHVDGEAIWLSSDGAP